MLFPSNPLHTQLNIVLIFCHILHINNSYYNSPGSCIHSDQQDILQHSISNYIKICIHQNVTRKLYGIYQIHFWLIVFPRWNLHTSGIYNKPYIKRLTIIRHPTKVRPLFWLSHRGFDNPLLIVFSANYIDQSITFMRLKVGWTISSS